MNWQDLSQQFLEGIFAVSVFFQTWFQVFGLLPAPCEAPVLYTLGDIDSRFQIAESDVLAAVKKAEALWEDASGKNLFEYSETTGLPVQFVYDERQERTEAGKDLQAKLDALNLKEDEAEVQNRIKNYEAAKKNYENLKARYEADLASYNARVEKVNKSGGASEKEYEELKKQERSLKGQFEELEQNRIRLNSLADAANARIEGNRALVETYNKEITTFQDVYGGEGEIFDQGVYTGTDITIYQYEDEKRLVLVLAHEMGHALGIDHVEDPEALMYYLMRDQDVAVLKPSETDIRALENACQKPQLFQ